MPTTYPLQNTNIVDEIENIKQQNPKLVEAMRLFDISSYHYQVALNALDTLRTYQSKSTTPLDSSTKEITNGELE